MLKKRCRERIREPGRAKVLVTGGCNQNEGTQEFPLYPMEVHLGLSGCFKCKINQFS